MGRKSAELIISADRQQSTKLKPAIRYRALVPHTCRCVSLKRLGYRRWSSGRRVRYQRLRRQHHPRIHQDCANVGAARQNWGRIVKIELIADDARATVLSHGAQVISWFAGGSERLYMSPTADLSDGAAIRGGIPVCFPQFDQRGLLPKHGFARNREWRVVAQSSARVELELTDNEDTQRIWPHRFRARITVTLERNGLDVELQVENRGTAAFEFTGALHSYVRVDDRVAAHLDGLAGVEYRDHRSGVSSSDPQGSLLITTVGRTYRNPDHALALVDGDRRIDIESHGFENVVVWNPGTETVFADLPAEGWREFLCVEAAQVTRAIQVGEGKRWVGGQRLRVA